MDRKYAQRSVNCSSMQTHRSASVESLLRTGNAESSCSCAYETDRRDLHGKTLLRLSEDLTRVTEGGAQRQSKTSPRGHARFRFGGQSTRPKYLEEPSGAPQISVSPAWPRNLMSTPRVEYRYHIHSAANRLCIFGRSNRLVQSVSAFLPPLKQSGGCFLLGCLRGSGRDLWATKNLQYRPGRSVLFSGICKCSARQRYSFQHGWARASFGQHLCGALMEICEI